MALRCGGCGARMQVPADRCGFCVEEAELGLELERPTPAPPAVSSRAADAALLSAQGLSNVEIARRMGAKPGTVSVWLSRARRADRELAAAGSA